MQSKTQQRRMRLHRAPNIVGDGGASFAQYRATPRDPAVGVGAAEPHTEGARERGLGHARVGAHGERAVAMSHP